MKFQKLIYLYFSFRKKLLSVAMGDSLIMELSKILEGRRVSGADLVGVLEMEMVRGRTVATRSMARYPLKFMVPSNVARGGVDAVWVYIITYGGGIVSGDSVAFSVNLKEGCTGILTTQASTKVYHSSEGKIAKQIVHALVSDGALLAVLPDPVTCFHDAKYFQEQTFKIATGGSLVLVDWLTSGRRGRGEVWTFESYLSCNSVFITGRPPLLIDKVHLSSQRGFTVAERMYGLHVIGLVVLCGPRVKDVRKSMEIASCKIAKEISNRRRTLGQSSSQNYEKNEKTGGEIQIPDRLMVSCSQLGEKGEGLLVRISSSTTEAVYEFLKTHLAPLTPQLGAPPYHSLG